jgi:hypothetical protein
MSGNQTGDDGPDEQADLHVALGRWLRLLRGAIAGLSDRF